jgi:hypothetical protein
MIKIIITRIETRKITDPYFTKIDVEDKEDEDEETERTSDEIGGDNTRKEGTEEPGGPDGGWNRRGNIGPFGGGRSGFLISLEILDGLID